MMHGQDRHYCIKIDYIYLLFNLAGGRRWRGPSCRCGVNYNCVANTQIYYWLPLRGHLAGINLLPTRGSGDWTHVIRLSDRHLCPLKFLISPCCILKVLCVWVFCPHVYMGITWLQCLHSPEEGNQSPGTEIKIGWLWALWMLETKTQFLWQSCKCS